ncbi:MAG: helix-turn-helix domain-containing protein [Ilumatobacteraceae bacterium]
MPDNTTKPLRPDRHVPEHHVPDRQVPERHVPEHRAAVPATLLYASDVAGDRWVLRTLAALVKGPRRFGDLVDDVGGIAPNMLINRLRRMEREGLLAASTYIRRPPRYVYELTGPGRELAAILPVLEAWASRHTGAEPPRHSLCGTPVEMVRWCPSCRTPISSNSDVDGDVHDGDVHGEVGLRWV